MKMVWRVLFACLLASSVWSAHAAQFKVQDYGAKADGKTLDTAAIQRAIDAATKAGGGTVVFKSGTYLTGAIFLKSHVCLRVDRGVTLLGVQKLADYPIMPTRVAGIEMRWPAALINTYQQSNVSISGQGVIDGNGKFWWDSYWARRKDYDNRGLRWAADYDAQRPGSFRYINHPTFGFRVCICTVPAFGLCTSAIRPMSKWMASPFATTSEAEARARMASTSILRPLCWSSTAIFLSTMTRYA